MEIISKVLESTESNKNDIENDLMGALSEVADYVDELKRDLNIGLCDYTQKHIEGRAKEIVESVINVVEICKNLPKE